MSHTALSSFLPPFKLTPRKKYGRRKEKLPSFPFPENNDSQSVDFEPAHQHNLELVRNANYWAYTRPTESETRGGGGGRWGGSRVRSSDL